MMNGDELLATRCSGEITDGTLYSKIRVFHLTNQGAGLIPWILCSPDAEVQILNESIVAMIDAPADIEKQYLTATSNIQLLS